MNNFQFQTEPVTTVVRENYATVTRYRTWSPTPTASDLWPVLLRAVLTGRIADSDRDVLDCLAPENQVTFLVQGGQWLHPDDVPLFPLDVIGPAVSQVGATIFTHRYCPQPASRDHAYRVWTLGLTVGTQPGLVLGFFGTEAEWDVGQIETQIHAIADVARAAAARVASQLARIQTALAADEPCVLVNRDSGRIILGNEEAARALKMNVASLFDLAYDDFEHQLRPTLGDRRLVLENLQSALSELCLVSLPTAVGNEGASTAKPSSWRRQLGVRVRNACYLARKIGAKTENRDDSAVHRLNNALLDELHDLELLTHGVDPDAVAGRLEKARQPQSLIAGAVQAPAIKRRLKRAVVINDQTSDDCLATGGPVVEALIGATMLSHYDLSPDLLHTTITLDNDSLNLAVRIDSIPDGEQFTPEFDPVWLDLADHLAQQAGVQTDHAVAGAGLHSILRVPR